MQTGNNGETGGLSRAIEGQPVPATKYVNDGISPYVVVAGIVLIVAAILVAVILVSRRRKA